MKRNSHTRNLADTKAARIGKNILTAFFLLYSCITLFLMGNTFLSSFKTRTDLVNNTLGFPKSFTLENYRFVLLEDHFGRYFINSLLLVVMGLGLLLLCASMVAYGISRFQFKGKSMLRSYFLIGLMFPVQLGILPLFIMLTRAHLNNTLIGVALLYAANMSFPVFVFSNFFRGIPWELSESAKIDGANEWQVFWNIIIPISKPVLFTIGLINFVLIWNDFYIPLVFLTKSSVRTLTLGVYTYMNNFLATWHLVFAAVIIALLPVIIVFFCFSEQIADGVTSGAIKG